MTSLLPPNLLRLFAPRPQPQFLKPLTRDEINRGPDRLGGCAELVRRVREEAEDAAVKEGMAERPATAPEANGTSTADAEAPKDDTMDEDVQVNGKDGKVVDVGEKEEGEEVEQLLKDKGKGKGRQQPRPKKNDKIAEMGLVGQEAVKVRRELRTKRQEEYKKNLEKNCELSTTLDTPSCRPQAHARPHLVVNPQDDPNAGGDPYKTLFISRLVNDHNSETSPHTDTVSSQRKRPRLIFDANLKCTVRSSWSRSSKIAKARARVMALLSSSENGI